MTVRDAINDPETDDTGDRQSHGTRMCSVAAGNYAGVAKSANIVSIKKDLTVESVERGLGMILNDVAAPSGRGYRGRAVVNLSFG